MSNDWEAKKLAHDRDIEIFVSPMNIRRDEPDSVCSEHPEYVRGGAGDSGERKNDVWSN